MTPIPRDWAINGELQRLLAKWISPSLGVYSPASSITSTDFPDPILPASPTTSPGWISKLTWLITGRIPKLLDRLETRNRGSIIRTCNERQENRNRPNLSVSYLSIRMYEPHFGPRVFLKSRQRTFPTPRCCNFSPQRRKGR